MQVVSIQARQDAGSLAPDPYSTDGASRPQPLDTAEHDLAFLGVLTAHAVKIRLGLIAPQADQIGSERVYRLCRRWFGCAPA
jgi:hypothetical protein